MACAHRVRVRLAAILKGPVYGGTERSGAGRAWDMGEQLRCAVGLSGLHQEWWAAEQVF
jgi:hypothetical protein